MVSYCSCCLCLYFGSAIMLVTYFVLLFSYFPSGFEGRIWDLIVSVPDHCLSFYFAVEYSSCFNYSNLL